MCLACRLLLVVLAFVAGCQLPPQKAAPPECEPVLLEELPQSAPLPQPPPPTEPGPVIPAVATIPAEPNQQVEQGPPPRKVPQPEPITLQLDDVELRKALEILSRQGKMNILVSPGATGRVTASLRNVTPDEALEAILQLTGNLARRRAGVVYVYSPEDAIREAGRDPRLSTRVYRLNYVRAADVERLIKPLLSMSGKITTSPPSEVGIGTSVDQSTAGGQQAGGGGTPPPMSGADGGRGTGGAAGGLTTGGDSLAGGEIIVIQDREAILAEADQIIAQVDVRPLQVLIEAVILRVTLNKGQEFGVNFGLVNSARTVLTVSGNGATLNAAVGFDPQQVTTPEGLVRGTPVSGFSADEPGLKFGFVGNNVTGFIRSLRRYGKLEVLATPRLLVLNKQRAELQLGQRLGFTTFSQSQVSTVQQVQFLNVGTQLRVRPFIASDGLIRMEVNPERSSGQIVNNVPQTDVAQVTTNVMVPDGATLVIGGLMESVDDRRQGGQHLLSDLPLVGALFRERQQFSTRTELIVLLTPRIWDPRAGAVPRCLQPPYPVPAQTSTAPIHLGNPGP